MIVIKLGGSLAQSDMLVNCLHKLKQNYKTRSIVIVPGGGAFADQVRIAQQQFQFDDSTAHKMAILAVQQMAFLINGLNNTSLIQQHKTVIWSPDIIELDNARIRPSWDITSDSLSAWVANTLSAKELILVKAATINKNYTLQQLAKANIIDQSFCDYVSHVNYKVTIINADNL
jgi:aspartokinase-like uncharacterized kinase